MLCTVDGETPHLFMKNMWISNSGTLCHTTNDDIGLYNVTNINKLVQGSLGNISATKKAKLCINVCQVDSIEWAYILWPVKYCTMAGANLYSPTCKLLQINKIESDHKNDIMVQSYDDNIPLDCHIKACYSCVLGVEFL